MQNELYIAYFNSIFFLLKILQTFLFKNERVMLIFLSFDVCN